MGTSLESPNQAGNLVKARIGRIRELAGRELDGDRLAMLAIHASVKNPSLLRCSQESMVSAIYDAAKLGLEFDGRQGALVPFKGQVQFIPMYRGLILLAAKDPAFVAIEARVAYERDTFEVHLGTSPRIEHRPMLAERGEPVAYYAVAHLKGGYAKFEVMLPEDIERIRKNSPGAKSGRSTPWDDHYDEMAKKTVLKRLLKTMPLQSRRLDDAINHDNAIESGDVVEITAHAHDLSDAGGALDGEPTIVIEKSATDTRREIAEKVADAASEESLSDDASRETLYEEDHEEPAFKVALGKD